MQHSFDFRAMADTNPFDDADLGWHWVDKWGMHTLYAPDKWNAVSEIMQFFPDVGDPQWYAKVYSPKASTIKMFHNLEEAKAWAIVLARLENTEA